MAVLGPPGGDRFRPLLTPAEAGGDKGEDARGEDWKSVSYDNLNRWNLWDLGRLMVSKIHREEAVQRGKTMRQVTGQGAGNARASRKYTIVKDG